MQVSFRSFGLGLILSTLLVYLILVAQFKSFLDPLLILLAVPTGLTGVLLMLFATGTTLNVMSLMGVVMMVGIVVSNSILIVEFTRRLREEGRPLREAVSLACRVRLRPVLMTSLATLIGLLPMAAEAGHRQRGLCAAGAGDHRRTGGVGGADRVHRPGGIFCLAHQKGEIRGSALHWTLRSIQPSRLFMSRFAIRYPYLIIVVCLITCVVGVTSLVRMPVDLFPADQNPGRRRGHVLFRHAARADRERHHRPV